MGLENSDGLIASKEFIEFQRGVCKIAAAIDAIKVALIVNKLISKKDYEQAYDAVINNEYYKARMKEYDDAIEEINKYENMSLTDLMFGDIIKKAKEKSK